MQAVARFHCSDSRSTALPRTKTPEGESPTDQPDYADAGHAIKARPRHCCTSQVGEGLAAEVKDSSISCDANGAHVTLFKDIYEHGTVVTQ